MRRISLLAAIWLAVTVSVCVAQDNSSFTEDFEAQELDGWMLEGASVQQVGRSSALLFSGPGVAMRRATCGQSFTLAFSAQFRNGTGDVTFCISGGERQLSEYHLILNPEQIELTRLEGRGSQALGSQRLPQSAADWVQVAVTRNGGQFQVSLDNQALITAQDPNPLPAGGLAFTCRDGSGVAYDDISLSSGTGQVVQPAIPINIPGMVKPGDEVGGQPGGQPVGQPGGQPMTQVEIAPGALDDPAVQPISPQVAQRMARPTTRAEMVQALAGDPRTAQALRSIPGLGNRPVQELASTGLSGAPVMSVQFGPGGAGAPPVGNAQLDLQKRIQAWEAGVTFSPATARVTRSIGGTDLWMGILRLDAMSLFQDLGDLLAANSVPVRLWPNAVTQVARAGLWLPAGQASYMVAIKLSRHDSAPASWVTGNPPIVTLRTWYQPSIQLVPLPDGSGYVGLCTINAAFDAVKTGGIADVMTQNNSVIYVDLDRSQNATQQVAYNDLPTSYVWFGGFTVTRL